MNHPNPVRTPPAAAPVVQIPLAEIVADQYQPRKTRNGAYDEIKQSMQADGLYEPVILSKNPVIDVKGRGPKYIISIAGNTRFAIAKELGWKTIPARVVPLPDDINTWLKALNSNHARGALAFSDSAHALFRCYQAWLRADKENAAKPVAEFYRSYCLSYAPSYIYLAVETGRAFHNVKKEIPAEFSKSTASHFVHVRNKFLAETFKNFGVPENQAASLLDKWVKTLLADLKYEKRHARQDGAEDIAETISASAQGFLVEVCAADLCQSVLRQANVPASQTVQESDYHKTTAEKFVLSHLHRHSHIGPAGSKRYNPVTNPKTSLLRRIAEGRRQQEAAQRGGTSGQSAARRAALPGRNFQFDVEVAPPATTEFGQVTGNSCNRIYDRTGLRGALANLGRCFTSEGDGDAHPLVMRRGAETSLAVLRKLLPGLFFARTGKLPFSPQTAAEMLVRCVLPAFHSYEYAAGHHCDRLDSLLGMEQKYGMLSDVLTSLGLSPHPASSENFDSMLAMFARLGVCADGITNAHAMSWSAETVFQIRLKSGGKDVKAGRKYVGVWVWPRLTGKFADGPAAEKFKFDAFYGTPDEDSPVGYVAGFYDESKMAFGFRFPTGGGGTIKDVPAVTDTPREAIAAIPRSGFKFVVNGEATDNPAARFSTAGENTAMIEAVLNDKNVGGALDALEKQVSAWRKPAGRKPAGRKARGGGAKK